MWCFYVSLCSRNSVRYMRVKNNEFASFVSESQKCCAFVDVSINFGLNNIVSVGLAIISYSYIFHAVLFSRSPLNTFSANEMIVKPT